MSYTLSNFQIIRPPFEVSQEQTLEWIAKVHATAEGDLSLFPALKERLFRLGLGPEKIQRRGVVSKDCLHDCWDEMEIYRILETREGVCWRKRSEVFDRVVSDVFERFYSSGKLPDHLIHVTCTGYTAPSGAQKIAAKRNQETVVTHAYHMGCYASIPAIRMAMGSGGAEVVHTEICSLHLNPLLHETEQLVVQTLFADGFIKYSVVPSGAGLKVLALHETLIPDSVHAMSWGCERWGLKMGLSKDIAVLLARALPLFLQQLVRKSKSDNFNKAFFAIHPGGPKILETVERLFSLKPWQIKHSREVLRSCGNMSSATLPHIWEAMLRDPEVKEGARIVSLAFGPGLTICGGVFQCGR